MTDLGGGDAIEQDGISGAVVDEGKAGSHVGLQMIVHQIGKVRDRAHRGEVDLLAVAGGEVGNGVLPEVAAEREGVVVSRTRQQIIATAPVQGVIAATAIERVVAVIAVENVGAVVAGRACR